MSDYQGIPPGTILWTRNGAKAGNAIVVGRHMRDGRPMYSIESDFGNRVSNLSHVELMEFYSPGPQQDLTVWRRDRLALIGEPWDVVSAGHGIDCPKAPHHQSATGYLHGANDDTPYDVDGVTYCGRCHRCLP